MFHVWNKIKLIPAKNMYNIYKSLYRKMFYVSFYKNSRLGFENCLIVAMTQWSLMTFYISRN